MPPETRMWRHMAVFGSLPPRGAIVFDENGIPLGFADPRTGRMGKTPLEKLPEVLRAIDKMIGDAKRNGKNFIPVFIAHDAADGMSEKEGREERAL